MPRRTTEAVPDTRHRASRRLVATALVVMSMQLTACASAPSTDTGYDTWAAQMRAVVSDSNGIGGAGGSGPGSVELDYMRIGKWVVYAVCGHTDVVHVTVRGGGTILAATDVACGATVALPIAVDSTTVRHFEIQASRPKGASGEGWWEARVNRVSWQQSGIFVFK